MKNLGSLFADKIKTGSDQVASAIRDTIISGKIKPGTRLIEADISVQLGVSRSPLREAFRTLASEGLLTISPYKGVFVTKLNERDLYEIYELRILLESYGIRQACKSINKKQLEELRRFIQDMEKRKQSKDYLGYLEVSHKFHEIYMKSCDNERLYDLFNVLKNNIFSIQILSNTYSFFINDSMDEHREILSKIMEKDPDGAELAIKKHLRYGYKRAKECLHEK